MWKWIGGGCLIIVVLVCILIYGSYKTMSKIAAGGPSVSVTMAATPQRVFAALANADSQSVWRLPNTVTRISRKGMFAIGDTIFMPSRDTISEMAWIVDTVVTNQLLAVRGVALRNGMVMFRRRDSVFAVGDSTTVMATTTAMMSDSAAKYSARGGVVGGMASMASTMGIAGMKIQAEQELKQLKRHLEVKPVVPPKAP